MRSIDHIDYSDNYLITNRLTFKQILIKFVKKNWSPFIDNLFETYRESVCKGVRINFSFVLAFGFLFCLFVCLFVSLFFDLFSFVSFLIIFVLRMKSK